MRVATTLVSNLADGAMWNTIKYTFSKKKKQDTRHEHYLIETPH